MEVQPHHIKPEVCYTRPKYREGKTRKVVRVKYIYNKSYFECRNF